ncbi:cytochrome c biogenesis CcdA family protein [Ktedonobacter racemifer]|uniref:Cytochrome c biogenesis protein transmembrane region n=1 Tax=Ktedonobacter racemifer DSM 44963 TaxID=485913 RepID=D6TNX8_KTERA|nr:cytochrome c biogenesis protein CcdA [Ktedonobacter racemifer]EFH85514.1 cytochrome c biogenesis protein transmembrane region [Ktedonobacter racemifer DSM 44963]
MSPSNLSIGIAFMAGLVSFLSPCVLPLVPIYLGQLVGQSIYQVADKQAGTQQRLKTMLHASAFIIGFTIAFVALGATASTLGRFLVSQLTLLRHIGGVILFVIGLHLAGILKIPFLYYQKRIDYYPSRPSYWVSIVMGIVFAIAWSPCVGPILASILYMAAFASTLQQGVLLLLAYSLGLGIPFLLLGLGLNQLSALLKRLKPHLGKIEIATGIFMMAAGVVVFFNFLTLFNSYFRLS